VRRSTCVGRWPTQGVLWTEWGTPSLPKALLRIQHSRLPAACGPRANPFILSEVMMSTKRTLCAVERSYPPPPSTAPRHFHHGLEPPRLCGGWQSKDQSAKGGLAHVPPRPRLPHPAAFFGGWDTTLHEQGATPIRTRSSPFQERRPPKAPSRL
jgi:hypothetical protein